MYTFRLPQQQNETTANTLTISVLKHTTVTHICTYIHHTSPTTSDQLLHKNQEYHRLINTVRHSNRQVQFVIMMKTMQMMTITITTIIKHWYSATGSRDTKTKY